MDGLSVDDRLPAYQADYVTALDFGAKLENLRKSIEATVLPSREVSLAITQLQTAEFWWKEAVRKSRGV